MLEIWDAERFEEEKVSGRTHPLVIECSRTQEDPDVDNPEKGSVSSSRMQRLMLVKVASQHLDARGMFSEVYGNLIAREFGVTTPSRRSFELGKTSLMPSSLLELRAICLFR